jgi:NAD(P)-dependent dehydrogenase (short-subunit alcohol dehydrogenase family)
MGQLDGKVAVITGGASGIGAATVRKFVAEGARVMIADLQEDVAGALAAELGDGVEARRCNVAKEEDVEGVIRDAVARFGRLDVLFNNAGFGGAMGPFKDTGTDEYDLTMDVLCKSVFLGIKHASPIMMEQRSGSIISTASVCGLVPGIGPHVYTVAKAAVIMMTKTAALELAEYDVRANAICPGYIATPLAAGAPISRDAERSSNRVGKLRGYNEGQQPISRSGEADDVANVALFLASEASAWMTGTAQVIDGGLTLGGKPWRDLSPFVTEHRPIRLYNPETA